MKKPETTQSEELKIITSRVSCMELRELSQEVAPAKDWGTCAKGAALLRQLAVIVPQLIDEVLKSREEALLKPVNPRAEYAASSPRRNGKSSLVNALEGEDGRLQALFEKHLSLTVGITWWYIHKLRVWDGYDRKGFMGIDVHSLWIAFKNKYPTAEDYLQAGSQVNE